MKNKISKDILDKSVRDLPIDVQEAIQSLLIVRQHGYGSVSMNYHTKGNGSIKCNSQMSFTRLLDVEVDTDDSS